MSMNESPEFSNPGKAIGGALDRDQSITMRLEVMANNPFSQAIEAALSGHHITRRGWNAAGQWVALHYSAKGTELTGRFFVIKNAQGDIVPWQPSQGDMLAGDWAIIPTQPVYGG